MLRQRHKKPRKAKAITPGKATITLYWDGHDLCTTADDKGVSVSICPTFRKRLKLPDYFPSDDRLEVEVTLVPKRKLVRRWVPLTEKKS